MANAQLKTVLKFGLTLANCGVKAAGDTSALARAADFLPLLEEVPGLATVDGAELKKEWDGMDTGAREALVAEVAAETSVGAPALNAAVDELVIVGLDVAAAIARGVKAVEAMRAATAAPAAS